MTNVVRHAEAKQVAVTVRVDNRFRVEVTDDGIGIPPDGRRSGLLNLAGRAGTLGGRFDTAPDPGQVGTRLVWEVPLG